MRPIEAVLMSSGAECWESQACFLRNSLPAGPARAFTPSRALPHWTWLRIPAVAPFYTHSGLCNARVPSAASSRTFARSRPYRVSRCPSAHSQPRMLFIASLL